MKSLAAIVVFSGLCCSFKSFALQKFVSTTGNDNLSGSISDPWRTVQYGIDHISSGDTLTVLTGTYNEKIVFHQGGTASGFLNVFANGSGVILDGNGLAADAMVDITNYSHIRFKGFEIRNNIQNDAQGILVQGYCRAIELLENNIHDIHFSANPNDPADEFHNAQGIIVLGTDPVNSISSLLISGNELYDCRLGYSEGIAVNGNVDGFTISQNSVHDITNIGIVAIGHEQTSNDPNTDQARNGVISQNICHHCNSPYAYCGGIYIDGAKNVEITRNFCHSNDYGIEIGCEHPGKTASGIDARNNILANNQSCGLAFGGYDYPTNSGSVINSSFQSNTLVKNDVLNEGSAEITMNYTENCTVKNNIFYASLQGMAVSFAVSSVNPVFDYNLYFTESGDLSILVTDNSNDYSLNQFQSTGQEPNGLFNNPIFGSVLLDANSYQCDQNSPARNTGDLNYTYLTNELDYFGHPRGINGMDRGAAEFPEAAGIHNLSQPIIRIFPNPVSSQLNLAGYEGAFSILSVDGKTCLNGVSAFGTIELSNLFPGTYILVTSIGTAKFVKL